MTYAEGNWIDGYDKLSDSDPHTRKSNQLEWSRKHVGGKVQQVQAPDCTHMCRRMQNMEAEESAQEHVWKNK